MARMLACTAAFMAGPQVPVRTFKGQWLDKYPSFKLILPVFDVHLQSYFRKALCRGVEVNERLPGQ
jgi:hypothetical protein